MLERTFVAYKLWKASGSGGSEEFSASSRFRFRAFFCKRIFGDVYSVSSEASESEYSTSAMMIL